MDERTYVEWKFLLVPVEIDERGRKEGRRGIDRICCPLYRFVCAAVDENVPEMDLTLVFNKLKRDMATGPR